MNTHSMNVDTDAAFRGTESRYHKKRPRRKPKTVCSSMADECATTEDDDDEGIIVTDDDTMSPRKRTSHFITLVGTDGAGPRTPRGVSVPSAKVCKNNLMDALLARPYYRRTMTFQSFHLPVKPRLNDIGTRSASTEVKKNHHMGELPRRNRNVLRKLPLYRMKNDLKRKLHKLERKLSRIKEGKAVEKNTIPEEEPPSSPPQTRTPTHISGGISETLGKSRSAVSRSSSASRRMYSSRELRQKISESTQNLRKLESELSARREAQQRKARSASNKSSPKSSFKVSPLVQDETDDIVERRQQSDDDDDAEENPASSANQTRTSIRARRDKAVFPVKTAKKKKRKRKPIKQKANLRDFMQEIPIEGMDYKMEITLEPDLIARTRAGHIDFRKDPKVMVKTNKATDLRDEFSSYCGQRHGIKNWLFQV